MTVFAPATARPSVRDRFLGRRDEPHTLWHADWLLILVALTISGIGIAMIWSTTNALTQEAGYARSHFVVRQSLALALGLVGLVATASFDYRRWRELWPLLYGLVVPLLIAVRFVGGGKGGTTAWFDLGPLQFQPSEVAKLVIVIAVAGYCHTHRGELDAWRLAVAVTVAGIAMALTLLQNDLGTVLVMGACAVGVLFVSGLRAIHMFVLFGLAASVLLALLVTDQFDEYRIERLVGFVNQEQVENAAHANDTQYTLQQSRDAIAHGGAWGQGYGKGDLTQNGFVPEQHTDFIFTAIAEELGFAGAAGLLGLYSLLCWRIWRAAMLAQDFQGTLLCVGVLAIIVFQIFENVGMTMGIMPITGIPLPFVSYGGSALIAYFAALGIVLNVHMRRFS
jgi:rod shape determining protein RodA